MEDGCDEVVCEEEARKEEVCDELSLRVDELSRWVDELSLRMDELSLWVDDLVKGVDDLVNGVDDLVKGEAELVTRKVAVIELERLASDDVGVAELNGLNDEIEDATEKGELNA